MAKKPEKPITDYKEYKKRLWRVRIITVLAIVLPTLIVGFALAVMLTGGKVLKIFGVQKYWLAMNYFYIFFYVITGIVVVIIIVYAVIFVTRIIIDYIKGLKNK